MVFVREEIFLFKLIEEIHSYMLLLLILYKFYSLLSSFNFLTL